MGYGLYYKKGLGFGLVEGVEGFEPIGSDFFFGPTFFKPSFFAVSLSLSSLVSSDAIDHEGVGFTCSINKLKMC